LNGTEGAIFPFWSPDSRFIAFFDEGKLQKVDIGGGPPLALCDIGQNPRRGSWSQDDVIIFSPTSLDSIHRISASGGTPVPVTKLDTSKGETTHRWATFLPDGLHFLYMAGTHAAGNRSEANAVYVADLKTGQSKLLLHARSNVEYADGHLLYVRDNVLVAHPFDPKTLTLSANPVPVAEQVQYGSSFFYATFSVSRSGMLVYRPAGERADLSMEWVDFQGKKEGIATGLPPKVLLGLGNPALSPDGNRLALSIADNQSGRNDIWTLDLARGVSTRLTFGAGDEAAPRWSPDGRQILYSQLDGSALNLYEKAADGSGDERILLKSEVHKLATDWSRDGKFVAANIIDAGSRRQDIGILAMDGLKFQPFLQSSFEESDPHFSPDGKWLTYWSDDSGAKALYVTPFPGPGGKYQVTSDGDDNLGVEWGPDGKEIYYVGKDSFMRAVTATVHGAALEIGAPRRLFQTSQPAFWVLSHDGKRFLFGQQPESQQASPIALMTDWKARLKR
jgi:Tol biopolymer transport system component